MKTRGIIVAALLCGGTQLLGQTFVQVPDLDPNNTIGPRLSATVVQNKLSTTLFAELDSKITFVNALANPPIAYEFASDGIWNRVMFGQKDVYINQFTPGLAMPGGIDFSGSMMLYVADRANSRVMGSLFNTGSRNLTTEFETPSSPALDGLRDVAWDGQTAPLTTNYFYAVSSNGQVSYWQYLSGTATLQWTFGAPGSSTGQFNTPLGVCVGHAAQSDGSTAFTSSFYVADAGNRRVVWLQRSQTGATWAAAASLPDGGVPTSCAVDHFGNVYLTDSLNNRIVKYTWQLLYLDKYGTYGTSNSAMNTFNHPHAIHVPYGFKANSSGQTIWYGEGRVLTAEDWTATTGAQEHYLSLTATLTSGPDTGSNGASISYFTTDHADHYVRVLDGVGNLIRTIAFNQLMPPGNQSWFWDGHKDDGTWASPSNYQFFIVAVSAYGCGYNGCSPTFYSPLFWFNGQPPCQPPAIKALTAVAPGSSAGSTSTQTSGTIARLGVGGGCGGGGAAPPVGTSVPATAFLRQQVTTSTNGASGLRRLETGASQTGQAPASAPGSLSQLVTRNGLRGLAFGIPASMATEAVSIRVYSEAGRLIRVLVSGRMDPGAYGVEWDGMDGQGRRAAPGVYLAVMSIGQFRAAQHLVLRW